MQTLIVAAGEGRRLGALGIQKPKCMFRAGNSPILEHLIAIFKRAGSAHFICVLGHQSTHITQYFGDGSGFGIDMQYVVQQASKGSAYAVRSASSSLKRQPFFYCDADILFHPDLSISLRDRIRHGSWDAILTFGKDRTIAPTHRSATEFSDALAAKSKQLGVDLGQYILMGVNILGPSTLDAISTLPKLSDREISVSEVLQNSRHKMCFDYAFYDGPWWHLAYPDDLSELDSKLIDLELLPGNNGRAD